MHDLAVEEVRDGREADVGVRPHGDSLARREDGGAHVIEEHERPDHAPLCCRQHAAHVEFAQAADARLDGQLDRAARRDALGLEAWLNAHGSLLASGLGA